MEQIAVINILMRDPCHFAQFWILGYFVDYFVALSKSAPIPKELPPLASLQ